jgi:hypothetical protein
MKAIVPGQRSAVKARQEWYDKGKDDAVKALMEWSGWKSVDVDGPGKNTSAHNCTLTARPVSKAEKQEAGKSKNFQGVR